MNSTIRALVAAACIAAPMMSFAAGDAPDFVQDGKDAIQACEKEYQGYLAVQDATQMADDSQHDLDDAMARAGASTSSSKSASKEAVPPYHKQCVAEKKKALLPEAKRFINSFKRPTAQAKAKKIVAQWMTTMDAIGSSVSEQEAAKFDTLANELQLDSL
ncbi:hypothetical protein ACFSHT_07145 [Paraburkholderia silviterrae]|uniref:Uncharacterized protein n=1 Tax=Paraburkholderia silviterrae TaxID=2528715 RepID=A0A4R5MCI6_9BURK|nr:hypothetical protein [Paraburkholderia silviterrae]TDG24666.1 hypothetical protein EYW47_08940 [Paraburkholderia silviterrae]